MPPSMPNPAKRMTANPARPARYRPGKATQQEESSGEDDEEKEEGEEEEHIQKRPQAERQPQNRTAPAARPQIQQNEDVDDDEDGFVTEDEGDEDESGLKGPTQAQKVATNDTSHLTRSTQLSRSLDPSEPQGDEQISEEESEEDDSESEEESSSEEEAPQRKFQRPTFIKKTERNMSSATLLQSTPNGTTLTPGADTSTATNEPTGLLLEDEHTRRQQIADLMIKDKLERDVLARSQGRKAWDDDDDIPATDQVDDTDDIDPAAEYAAWNLRELQRLKRDRAALIARETELEETARRRALTSAERDTEDNAFITRQKADASASRNPAQFMARYHHKGAFFQDDEAAELLKKRDLMGAKFQDDVGDKSTLPEYMRIRDMTKLGKKGRTRYTDLRGQDTGRFGEDIKRWRGAGDRDRGGPDLRGVDERFLPDRGGNGGAGETGANASVVGVRRERYRSRSPVRRKDENDRDGDTYRPSQRRRSSSASRSFSQSRSRSRSPRPSHRRRRSPSPYVERDKRRRVEA